MKQYDEKTLETLSTSELGRLYQENLTLLNKDAYTQSQLEKIIGVLRNRPISEREEVYSSIRTEVEVVTKQNDLSQAYLLRRISRFYLMEVLPLNPAEENRSQDKK